VGKLAVLQNLCLQMPTIVATGRFRPRVARAALILEPAERFPAKAGARMSKPHL